MAKIKWETRREGSHEAQVGPLRIVVHGYIGDSTGAYVSCRELSIDRSRLGDMPLDQARDLALKKIRATVKEMWDAVQKVD